MIFGLEGLLLILVWVLIAIGICYIVIGIASLIIGAIFFKKVSNDLDEIDRMSFPRSIPPRGNRGRN